jgi:hypothetical protein
MNATQERKIEQIKAAMLENASLGGLSNVEIKQLEVSENGHFVSLVIEVGRVGDEDTMASIYCRDRRQVFIGKRGGVQLASVAKGTSFKIFNYNQVRGMWNVIHTLPY